MISAVARPLRLKEQPVVLVVEDEPSDAALIRFHLNERDPKAFQVLIVRTLADALGRLEPGTLPSPDVILADLNLPDSTGPATVQRLRARGAEVPIVVLTGNDDPVAITAALEAGAQDYLVKGEGGSALRRAVRYAILRHQRDEDDRLAATVFNVTESAIAILDADGLVEKLNPAFRSLTGLGEADLRGRPIDTILGDGRGPGWHAPEAGGTWEAELWTTRPDGTRYCAWVRIHAVLRSDRSAERHVAMVNDITARKDTEDRLARQATHDHLTDLPNRFLFNDRLEWALQLARRKGGGCALLFIDLDGFKPINDTYGHSAGDAVLKGTARRLLGLVRASDTVARLGGDEFAILLPDCAGAGGAAEVADKILSALREPFDLGGATVRVSASIGIALFPRDADDAPALVKAADAAMYRAKRTGKDAFALVEAA